MFLTCCVELGNCFVPPLRTVDARRTGRNRRVIEDARSCFAMKNTAKEERKEG
jgi:hypothetical protein